MVLLKMRYSYGIVNHMKIITYRPEIFKRTDDLLVFSEKDFNKWYSDIKEYLDGLYQINSKIVDGEKYVDITDLELAIAIIHNITDELDHIFDTERTQNFPYYYVSKIDKKYKNHCRNLYGRSMQKIDTITAVKPIINYRIKQGHIMELIEYVNRLFDREFEDVKPITLMEVQKKLSDLL